MCNKGYLRRRMFTAVINKVVAAYVFSNKCSTVIRYFLFTAELNNLNLIST